MVHPGQGGEMRVVPCSGDLFFRKLYAAFKVPLKTFHQELVVQHFQQRRRERKGDPEVSTIVQQVLKDTDKRYIGFQHCFMQPRLLKMVFMLRISDIGEMSMEDEQEVTRCC